MGPTSAALHCMAQYLSLPVFLPLPIFPCFYLLPGLSLSVFLFQSLPAGLTLSPRFPLNFCSETWH